MKPTSRRNDRRAPTAEDEGEQLREDENADDDSGQHRADHGPTEVGNGNQERRIQPEQEQDESAGDAGKHPREDRNTTAVEKLDEARIRIVANQRADDPTGERAHDRSSSRANAMAHADRC